MTRKSEFASALQMVNSGRFPLVPMLCTAQGATWHGKWHFNTSTEWVRNCGGPWDTRDAAVAAVLATGLYRLREGTQTPHLDAI